MLQTLIRQEENLTMANQESTSNETTKLNSYEQKQEERRERLLDAADKAEREGDERLKTARSMSSVIPFGQPILVGHHSEKRDRNFRSRIRNNYEKGFEAKEKAAKLRERAASVGKAGISSDDPAAIQKLTEKLEKLEKLEKQQEHYKAINKALKRADKTGDDTPLRELGLSDQTIAGLKEPDFAGRRGIPSYVLTNNNSNMRRIRERIEALRATAEDQTSSEQHGEVRIVDNVEENRVQIFFPYKPDRPTRQTLKCYGFRWSPTADAWQQHRSLLGAADLQCLRREVASRLTALGYLHDAQGLFSCLDPNGPFCPFTAQASEAIAVPD